jgi:hypothetical protein
MDNALRRKLVKKQSLEMAKSVLENPLKIFYKGENEMYILNKIVIMCVLPCAFFIIGALAPFYIDAKMFRYDIDEGAAKVKADALAQASANFADPPSGATCLVTKIINGSSVVIEYEGRSYAVKLTGLDCPTGTKKLSWDAKRRLSQCLTQIALEDWTVTIAYNAPSVRGSNNYLLCDLLVKLDPQVKVIEKKFPNGSVLWINYELIRSGYSKIVADEVSNPKFLDSLREAERKAYEERCGIWKDAE